MTGIYEEIFEWSPVAMLLVDAKGTIARVNKHAEQLFDYGRAELLQQRVEILIPEAARGGHPKLVKQYVSSPLPRQMGRGRDLFGVKKTGDLFPVEVGLNPISRNGDIMVLASVIDITERQRADERFKAAVDAAPNGMLMIDGSGRIVICNKMVGEIFGYGSGELIDELIEVLVPEGFRGPHPNFVASFFENPSSRAMGIGRELFGRHKSGQLVPVEIGLQPIHSADEPYVIASIVDISRRRAIEAEIERKTEEIEEFSYRTSHDLRSPLKSISAMSNCIAEDLESGDYDAASSGVEHISQLTEKLLKLVEDLLTLTRADAESNPAEPFDFAEYGATVKQKYAAVLEETNTVIEVSLAHSRDLVTEAARLTQVLDNLIGNGIKYGDEEEELRIVSLRTFNSPSRFFIQVEDNGMGIPVDSHANVFGMFKRFHGGSIPGSGLGLYIVKKQIGRLGAEITFESSPKGTIFHIEFALEPGGPR